jgi:hypothetical protein
MIFHFSKTSYFTIPRDIALVYYIDNIRLIGPGKQTVAGAQIHACKQIRNESGASSEWF